MLVNVDTSNEACQKPAFLPLEAGQYDLQITGVPVFKPSKTPAKDGKNYGYIEVIYKEVNTGRELRDWISLNPTMAWKKNSFIRSANIDASGGQVDLNDLTSQVVRAVVKQISKAVDDKEHPGTKKTVIFNEVAEYLWS